MGKSHDSLTTIDVSLPMLKPQQQQQEKKKQKQKQRYAVHSMGSLVGDLHVRWQPLSGAQVSMDLKERTLASPVHVSVTLPETEENAAVLGKAASDLVELWLGEGRRCCGGRIDIRGFDCRLPSALSPNTIFGP